LSLKDQRGVLQLMAGRDLDRPDARVPLRARLTSFPGAWEQDGTEQNLSG
jgi:hypothetical protein